MKIDRYEILKTLGERECVKTYLALDRVLDQKVVVKEYGSDVWNEALQQKAKLLFGKFEISGLAIEKEYFTEDGKGYVVSEYLSGGNLKNHMLMHRGISAEEALELLLPVIEALQHMHSLGIVYECINPKTLCFDESGRLCLVGIGIENEDAYLVPEQAKDVGPWSDIYALCAVWYEMVTGRKPRKSQKKLPSEYVQISPESEQVMMRGLEEEIQKRYFSVQHFLQMAGKESESVDRLDGLMRHVWEEKWLEITTTSQRDKERDRMLRRRLYKRIAAGVLSIIAVVAAGVMYLHSHQEIIFGWKLEKAQEELEHAYQGNDLEDRYLQKGEADYDTVVKFLNEYAQELEVSEMSPMKTYTLDKDYPELSGIAGTRRTFALDKDTIYDAICYFLKFDENIEPAAEEYPESRRIFEYEYNEQPLDLWFEKTECYNAGNQLFSITYDPASTRVRKVTFEGNYEHALEFLTKLDPMLRTESPLTAKEAEILLKSAEEEGWYKVASKIHTVRASYSEVDEIPYYVVEIEAEETTMDYGEAYAGCEVKGSKEYEEFLTYVEENSIEKEENQTAQVSPVVQYELSGEAVAELGKPCNQFRMSSTKEELLAGLEQAGYSVKKTEERWVNTVTLEEGGSIDTLFLTKEIYDLGNQISADICVDAVNGDVLYVYLWQDGGKNISQAKTIADVSAILTGESTLADKEAELEVQENLKKFEEGGREAVIYVLDTYTNMQWMYSEQGGYICCFNARENFFIY